MKNMEFPLEYEIIGRRSNIHNTNHWPEINVLYDENKLIPEENEVFKEMIKYLVDEAQHSGMENKFNDGRIFNTNYLTVTELNGQDINSIDYGYDFSNEDFDVKNIHDKLYGESESLNESINKSDKNLRAINVLLSLVSWDGLCDIWAEYNPDDKEYEIRSKTTARDFYNDEALKELSSLEDSIKSMGIKVYIYAPWFVDNCDDEVKFMNESSNESEKDTKKLFKIVRMIMEDMILPDYDHLICSYEITLNEVFNIPEVTVLFIGGHGTKLWPMTQGIRQMYLDVLEDISKEIANYTGVVIGVRGEQTPKCGDKENIYLRESENKSEDKKLKLLTKMIHEFFDDVSFIDIKKYENKPMIRVYFDNDEEAGNEEIYFAEQIQDKIYEYTGIKLVPYWHTIQYNTDADFRLDAIKLKYDNEGNVINESESLNESDNRETDKKLKLVKEMIYSLFDEVEFIEVDTNYEGKPLIKIYHDVDDTAANYDNWFTHRIIDEIKEMTGDGIILSPYWAARWDWKYKNADFYIDVEKLKYDNLGNVINESENKKERKFNRLIQKVEDYLNSNEYPSVKKFTVYYEDTHDDVIVNIFFDAEVAVKLGGGINSVIKRVGKQVMEDLEVFPMDFKYYIHFDRDINESTEKQPKYLNIIKDLVEPFKDEDCVCDIRVLYNEEDDMYLIDLNMGTEELNEKFFAVVGMTHYVKTLRLKIKETIKDYLPIDNLYVGSYASPNCKWKPLNESTFFLRRVDTRLMEKEFFENLNIITDVYLRKYIDGIDFNFETFENHVIDYFMDGYYDDLTNGGENDYPHDEVHEFLSKYFHDKIKDRYNLMFKFNINESSIKKKSLVKLIEKDGLYDFIEMTGLDFNQVRSLIKQIDNPKELLKQYIREFVIEDDPNSGENSGVLIGVEIPLSNTKYVNDIMVQDSDQIAVEIFEFGQDEYGHTEQKDQYLTTINNLTNEELLSMLSWMMEIIQNGYWD
jgi:hypothetical protein